MDELMCGCGLLMSKNPHPDAGKPQHVVDVGAEFVCVPCTVKAMAGWSSRYHEAERKAAKYREALVTVHRYDDGLRASNWSGLANVVKEALDA